MKIDTVVNCTALLVGFHAIPPKSKKFRGVVSQKRRLSKSIKTRSNEVRRYSDWFELAYVIVLKTQHGTLRMKALVGAFPFLFTEIIFWFHVTSRRRQKRMAVRQFWGNFELNISWYTYGKWGSTVEQCLKTHGIIDNSRPILPTETTLSAPRDTMISTKKVLLCPMVCSHKRGKVSWENAQHGKATWSLLVMEDIRANYLLDVTKNG